MGLQRWHIKIRRYFFGAKYIAIFNGLLKGYKWSTAYSYEYILGNYENEKVLNQILHWCKPNTIFYDLGANIGYHSILAAQKITVGKIYSFEPLPKNMSVFKAHLQLNETKLKNKVIELNEFAIADVSKEVEFSNHDNYNDGNTYVNQSFVFNEATQKIKVQAYSIDELITKSYLLPDVIKIDVEGAELDVLKGAVKTLESSKPNIFLATHSCHVPNINTQCIEFLKQLNYVCVHTGNYNKNYNGLDDYFAVHESKLNQLIFTAIE
jgi:FkbM family methyltransferase